MLDLEFTALSDPGRVRDHNEDCLGHFAPPDNEWVRAHGWLFALADGVGGQDHGEVASRVAILIDSRLSKLCDQANNSIISLSMLW